MAVLPQASRPDPDAITLSRLLHHLDTTLATTSPTLRHNPYERRKISANFEYARTILLRLEHVQQRNNGAQTDLKAKRDLIKSLQTRLQELEAQGDDHLEEDEDEDENDLIRVEAASSDSESDDEDGKDPYAPAIRGTKNSVDTEMSASQEAAHNIESALRQRKQPNVGDINAVLSKVMTDQQAPPPPIPIAKTTGASTSQTHSAARAALFASSSNQAESSDREAILTAHRGEQDALTSSLLSLATQLKNSAQSFSTSLESEKSVLERAAQGLDKNIAGMDAAGRRMGTLRRMTEGKGWWGRMMLYAWIAGLWLIIFLVVFIGPKIRF